MYIKKGVINPPEPYCTGGPDDIGCIGCRVTTCRGVHVGRTKLVWKTVAVTGWGFIDDSYRILAKQDGVVVYDSGEKFRTASSGSSGLIGNADGGNYRVEFKCENDFWWCEGTSTYTIAFCFPLVESVLTQFGLPKTYFV